MIKQPGGVFIPASDIEHEKTIKFKTGEMYTMDVPLTRNPQFLKKAMVFFHFCYEHWNGDRVYEFCSPNEQFDRFRKDLTILAGFYVQTPRMDGTLRTEAESLAFASMTEERFRECYHALINAALKHIFPGCGVEVENKLVSFF